MVMHVSFGRGWRARDGYREGGGAPWKKAKRWVGRAGKKRKAKSNFKASRRCIDPPQLGFAHRLFSLPAAWPPRTIERIIHPKVLYARFSERKRRARPRLLPREWDLHFRC